MENKIKINSGLASIILVACLFAGWQTLLIVSVLMFLFCEVEDKVKQVAVSVITFYVGYTIVSTGWDIIMNIAELVISTINSCISFLKTTFELYDLDISILMTPVGIILNVLDNGFSILLTLAKLGFIIAVLSGTPTKSNPLSAKINEYVNKAINYVNGNVGVNMAQQAPRPQQAAPVQPQQPVQQAPQNPTNNNQNM